MDEGLSEAVKEVFVRLYREGLIYRSHYIINWCPDARRPYRIWRSNTRRSPGSSTTSGILQER